YPVLRKSYFCGGRVVRPHASNHAVRSDGNRILREYSMRAFKFRSSSQIDFAFDIIFNQRLHCADWSRLNDPMEGMFAYSSSSTNGEDPKKVVERIIREKQQIKIC